MRDFGIFSKLASGLRRWFERNRKLQEIHAMGGSELSDLGLSRSDLHTLACGGEATQRRMTAMGARLGVPDDAVFGERWRAVDMARRCAHCDDLTACARYLAGDDDRDDYHRFCPNAAEFDDLKVAEGRKQARNG